MNLIIKKFSLSMICIFLIGCTTSLDKYTNLEPKLNLFNYFKGQTEAWGIFEDRFGNIKKQFKVNITGTVEGSYLKLNEEFVYKNGKKERRIWNIKKINDYRYQGTANDIQGIAEGKSRGNALNWQYSMNIKVKEKNILVHFDDWMYLQENNILINKAKVTKWGFKIGEVLLFFSKKN
jgi:hypothetical protein